MTAEDVGRRGRAVLLDTCALLDLTIQPEKITPGVREALARLSTALVVSAASAWEVAVKTRHGKLPGGEHLIASWDQCLTDLQAQSLVIDPEDALRAGGLQWPHRDPFDRMLVAQAIRRNLPVATSDSVILDAAIVTSIDTRRRRRSAKRPRNSGMPTV